MFKHNNKEEKEILPFVTQYQPLVSTSKEVLIKKMESYTKPNVTSPNFKEPPIISYQKRKIPKEHTR